MIVDPGTTEDTAMKRTELAEIKNTKPSFLLLETHFIDLA